MLALAIACTGPVKDHVPNRPDSQDSHLQESRPQDSDADTDDSGEPVVDGVRPSWDPDDFLAVFDVGPGQDYETPGEVPWEGIGAGTLIRIHGSTQHYRDKWVIDVPGTEEEPIVILGVPNEDGVGPVIQGKEATTRVELDYWNEDRSVIKIGGSSNPGRGASWIWVQGLEIRGGFAGYTFTDDRNLEQGYADNAAAIHIEAGSNIHIVGNVLTDSGNGLFVSSESADVLIRGNHIYGNGNVDSAYEHNSYTEADGIVFEYNWYERLREGALGNNLKDRSAGTVVRYNWIKDGNRQLDLVDTDAFQEREDYGDTWVYGNILIESEDQGNSQIVHFGGDSEDTTRYRNGTLYFWNNTVHSKRAGNTTLVRLSGEGESMEAVNNVLWTEGPLGIRNGDGAVRLEGNWISEWVDGWEGSGTVTDDGNGVSEAAPPLGEDYVPTAAIPTAIPWSVEGHPIEWQYRPQADRQARIDTEDAGALN